MRQQEAEQEAARRNAEDERRARFVFYALDHSAGMVEDAWEVEMRLHARDEPVAAGVSMAAGPATQPLGAAPPATPERRPAMPEPEEPGAGEPEVAEADAADLHPGEYAEPVAPAPAVRATEPGPLDALPPLRRMPRPRLIQVWGAFVIVVGLLFVAATLLLAVGLRDYTHFGALPTAIGIGLGMIAVLVGVALVRTM